MIYCMTEKHLRHKLSWEIYEHLVKKFCLILYLVFTCALQKEVIYHGKMYVSQHHVCFHSSVLLKETKVRQIKAITHNCFFHKDLQMIMIKTD